MASAPNKNQKKNLNQLIDEHELKMTNTPVHMTSHKSGRNKKKNGKREEG
jgi:hypothetical protein